MDDQSQQLSCNNRGLEGWNERVVLRQELIEFFAQYDILHRESQELDQPVDRVTFPLKPIYLAVRHTGKKLIPLFPLVNIF